MTLKTTQAVVDSIILRLKTVNLTQFQANQVIAAAQAQAHLEPDGSYTTAPENQITDQLIETVIRMMIDKLGEQQPTTPGKAP